MALRILSDAAETEAVVQETFAEIWHQAGKFDSRMGGASAWAAMIQSILAGLPLEDSRAIELAYFGGLAEQRSRGLQELPDALKGCIRRGLLTLRFQLDRLED
jgi:DNA-directed RNA polymerase specialized sigma24 family protein